RGPAVCLHDPDAQPVEAEAAAPELDRGATQVIEGCRLGELVADLVERRQLVREVALALLAGTQALLRRPALGDIPAVGDDRADAWVVEQVGGAALEQPPLAVPVPAPALDRRDRPVLSDQRQELTGDTREILRMDELEDL